MSGATTGQERNATRVVRLAPGDAIDLDVEWCDVVPSSTAGATELRLKGRMVGSDGRPQELVRLFFDLEMIEQPLRRAGVLRDPVPDLPTGERIQPLRIAKRRLTIAREKNASGATWYRVALRDGAMDPGDEELLADYHWAFAQARNAVVPLLEADRLAVGASDVLAVTATLFHERRRGRPGRG